MVPVAGKDLRLGDVHEDVYRLQVFLNNNGYRVTETGPGSPGNEVSIFNEGDGSNAAMVPVGGGFAGDRSP